MREGKLKYQAVTIKGYMEVLKDQETKNKFWNPNYKMFYREGVTDLEYGILKFTGFEAQYFSSFKVETIKL